MKYDPAADYIETCVTVEGQVPAEIRNVTTAEAMSRSDNAASRWFAANRDVDRISYEIRGAVYEYRRKK